MLTLGDPHIFIQIDFLVLVLICVVDTTRMRFNETIFVLVAVVLQSMDFGVAPHESFFGQFEPRQSTYLFYNSTDFIIFPSKSFE